MFVAELYINGNSIGYLQGNYSYETTKDLNNAYITSDLTQLKKKMDYIVDKTDFDDNDFYYEIIQYELKEQKRYKPKNQFSDDLEIVE